MEPVRQHQTTFEVADITVRTTNREEHAPATIRIEARCNCCYSGKMYSFTPNCTSDTRIFGVYSAHGSDADGAFDVTAGVVVSGGTGYLTVEAGDDLVFTGQGDMPGTVIAIWQRIWQYFEAHPDTAPGHSPQLPQRFRSRRWTGDGFNPHRSFMSINNFAKQSS